MANLGRVAIIGAGMAGLSCARRLADAGVAVTVLDKGRGLGGRIATRRASRQTRDEGTVDHGAVALHAVPGSEFAARMQEAAGLGAAAYWPAGKGWVGLPGMSGIVEPLARGLDLRTSTEVTALAREGAGWRLQGAGVPDTEFDLVVLAIPQPQARGLLAVAPALAAEIAGARMRAVWTAMVRFETALPMSGDMIRPDPGPVELAVRNSAKPGRVGAEAWVLHATEDWTLTHLEREKPEAAALLLEAFFAQTGLVPVAPTALEGHRWRYGLTVQALGQPYARDAGSGLAVCGDWCLGDSAEDAFASGQALARALLRQ